MEMPDPYNLKENGITDSGVLAAFQEVKRKDFVKPQQYWAVNKDGPLPIGYGQTISQPSLVAHMTQLLKVKEKHKVLEIGTGSGFQAAILAKLVKQVFSVETIQQLAAEAKKRLEEMGYENITLAHKDGKNGWKQHAPYDRIMVTAAAPELPEGLLTQLTRDGKMLIPIGKKGKVQILTLFDKNGEKLKGLTVRFVPLV